MRLLGNRLLLKKMKKTAVRNSIILPGSFVEPMFYAEVISMGPGLLLNSGERLEMAVKPGDKIMYMSTTGFQLQTKNGIFVILNERDVIVVLEGEVDLEEETE